MRFQIITIFPEFFKSPLQHGLLDKAISKQTLSVDVINLRDFADPPHNKTDDYPYGGGPGMVMTPGPLLKAIESAKKQSPAAKVYALSPGGRPLSDSVARKLAREKDGLILICGRYEGIDQRIIDHYCDGELSIGDYVLTGGEPAALVIIDAVSRMLPGVIGDPESVERDSFTQALTHPQYTRPPEFEGHKVPKVLMSGDHNKIEDWRKEAARDRTIEKRPDLAPILAQKRIWIVYLNPSMQKTNEEEFEMLCRAANKFDLGGIVYTSRQTDLRNQMRQKFSQATDKSVLPVLIKPSLKDALSAIEKKEQEKAIPFAIGSNDNTENISIERLTKHPAVLICGSVRPADIHKHSIRSIALNSETPLPCEKQITLMMNHLLKG